jgi:hypothetical protein
MKLHLALAVLLGARSVLGAAAAGRTQLSFDYQWRFKLGDPASAQPPLTTAATDPTFTNVSTGYACTQLSWSQLGRMGPRDCTGACSATPGCKAWMWAMRWPADMANTRGCFIHDGTLGNDPVCTKTAVDPELGPASGGMRKEVPPAIQDRTGVSWKEPGCDDSAWLKVDVPHDFILPGDGEDTSAPDYPYSEAADSHHGYIPRDKAGWYRKHFTLPAAWDGQGASWLHFEGIFQAADIFLNGKFLLRHTSGYLGFDVPLDAAHRGGAENVLAIRVDSSFGSGHWYEGGGLQRRVHLVHTSGQVRFATDGLFAQTEAGSVTAAQAVVVPSAEVHSIAASASVTIEYTLLDPSGAVVAHATTKPAAVAAGAADPTGVGGASLTVASPELWSVREPQLYTLQAKLISGEEVADSLNTTIGLRSIDWTARSKHFKLNDHDVHIRGFSHHSDFGAVGGAIPDRINVFRANALRSVGGNWWRTVRCCRSTVHVCRSVVRVVLLSPPAAAVCAGFQSHNPYRPALYDILDRTGILCWDENRDFNQMNVLDMERLVRRDRNHPS